MNTKATQENVINSIGILLRKAREELGLSQHDVAQYLCLKISTVRDIEADKTPTDLAATFLRGYIRSYAKLVHISEDELLPIMNKDISIQTDISIPMKSFSLDQLHRKSDYWLIIFTCLALIVVISLTSTWWWQNYKAKQEEIVNNVNRPYNELKNTVNNVKTSLSINNNDILSPKKLQKVTNNNFKAIHSTQAETESTTTIPNTMTENYTTLSHAHINDTHSLVSTDTYHSSSVSPLLNDQIYVKSINKNNKLVIKFTADCWLEVMDATGKKLFIGLRHKDDMLNLTGQTPLKLKIGAPSAVKINFQGQPIDLSYFIRTNQIAHLKVDNYEPLVN